MKTCAFYLFALLFSFEALAFESPDITTEYLQQQESKVSGPVVNVQNEQTVAWKQPNPSTGTQEQVGTELQNEFVIEIFIYALIILVYSIYWLQNYGQVKTTRAKHKILERDTNINGQRAK